MPAQSCGFWRQVMAGRSEAYFARCAKLRQSVGFRTRLPQLLVPQLRPPQFDAQLEDYRGELSSLYERIADTAACPVIVDCSKDPAHGLVLKGIAGIELYVVHIVRDPRAVAFSRQTPKLRSSLQSAAPMPRASFLETALKWTSVNFLCSLLRLGAVRYRRLRYEDFVAAPEATVRSTLAWMGQDSGVRISFTLPDERNHVALGNPDRMKGQTMNFALDERWKTQMPAAPKILTSLLTWPLRRIYGYK